MSHIRVAAGIVDALANVASVIREQGSSPHVVIMAAAAADHQQPHGIARAHAPFRRNCCCSSG